MTGFSKFVSTSYDMYSGEASGMQSPEPNEPPKTPLEDGVPEMEEGQALEVIELANGETIWWVTQTFEYTFLLTPVSQVDRKWFKSR